MNEEYDQFRILIREDGEFIFFIEDIDKIPATNYPEDTVDVGVLDPGPPSRSSEDLLHWVAEECQDFRFPDELTDAEIEEIRELTREELERCYN